MLFDILHAAYGAGPCLARFGLSFDGGDAVSQRIAVLAGRRCAPAVARSTRFRAAAGTRRRHDIDIAGRRIVPVSYTHLTEDDTVAGLNIGADDYIAKPFSVREVLARVRSVLRRTAPQEGQSRAIAFEGLHMDLVRKICTVDGTPLALTKKEFEILALLLSNRGRIFSREEILHQVWSDEVIVLDRTIDVNITRLRRKIGVYGDHIVTRLGYGYGFEE